MDKNKYYSYAMGMNDSILKLKEKGFEINKVKEDYEVIFDKSLASIWEEYIKENLEVEYWNEYLSNDEVIFNFHLKDGFKKYIVKDFNNDEVLKLCEKLCECKFESIEKMIKDNSFYNRLYN